MTKYKARTAPFVVARLPKVIKKQSEPVAPLPAALRPLQGSKLRINLGMRQQ